MHGLDERGMRFAGDVHRQLLGIAGSHGSRALAEHDPTYTGLRYAMCLGMANRIAERHPRHNAYRTLNDANLLCEIKPVCRSELFYAPAPSLDAPALRRIGLDGFVAPPGLAGDDPGLGPPFIVYQELASSFAPGGVPRLRHVTKVDAAWVMPLVPRLKGVDAVALTGKSGAQHAATASVKEEVTRQMACSSPTPTAEAKPASNVGAGATAVDAARARFLARKREAEAARTSKRAKR